MIRGHPPQIKFSSSLIKLEYHVNLSYLHLHQCAISRAPIPRILPRQPLTIKGLRGYLAGSVCVNTSTRREPSAFEQNTGCATRGYGHRHGRGVRARVQVRAQARVRAYLQRQFVNIKQRQQHPNKFMRRLREYCAIEVLRS